MGFPRQEYWNGLPFPSPGSLPNPGIKLRWQADFITEPPGKPKDTCMYGQIHCQIFAKHNASFRVVHPMF